MAILDEGNILVTGANGFVGQPLCEALVKQNWKVRGAVRYINNFMPKNVELVRVNDIDKQTVWSNALGNIDVVIHLAARVHVMKETTTDPLSEFRKVNVDGTRQLALQASSSGVKRLIYVSSVKVNGEKTTVKLFDELDPAAPEDAYGISKYEAELALKEVSAKTGLEVVILRPPLIYGPGVKGNFLQLGKIVARKIPLPFGAVNNSRSLLYVGNLVDALIVCATHPNAVGKTYLISDGEDISTPNLIKAVAGTLGIKARLFNCPDYLLKGLSRIAGKKNQVDRLLESLQIDNRNLKQDLGWEPKFTLEEGLKKTFQKVFNQ